MNLENRIYVIGSSGCRKTTFSRKLATKLSIPHVELDNLYWQENWQPVPDSKFLESVEQAVSKSSWVIDGNYNKIASKPVLSRATKVIWLNYSFFVILTRLLKRTIARSYRAEKLWGNNVETIKKSFFSRDSLLLWFFKSHSSRIKRYRTLFNQNQYAHIDYLEFKKAKQANNFLSSLN